jgi:hypothetical protein
MILPSRFTALYRPGADHGAYAVDAEMYQEADHDDYAVKEAYAKLRLLLARGSMSEVFRNLATRRIR